MRVTVSKELNVDDVINQALRRANRFYPENPMRVNELQIKSNRVAVFTLRVNNSRAKPARLSASGRRTCSVSWQAHYEFMQSLFTIDPNAKIVTGMAKYKGMQNFLDTCENTANKNIGSMMQPITMPELDVA